MVALSIPPAALRNALRELLLEKETQAALRPILLGALRDAADHRTPSRLHLGNPKPAVPEPVLYGPDPVLTAIVESDLNIIKESGTEFAKHAAEHLRNLGIEVVV